MAEKLLPGTSLGSFCGLLDSIRSTCYVQQNHSFSTKFIISSLSQFHYGLWSHTPIARRKVRAQMLITLSIFNPFIITAYARKLLFFVQQIVNISVEFLFQNSDKIYSQF